MLRGTSLSTTLQRVLHPGEYAYCNKMTDIIFEKVRSTADITIYKDGIPCVREPLHRFYAQNEMKYIMHKERYYYVVGTKQELQHWMTQGRPDFSRLHQAGYYQYNTWSTAESSLNWTAYLENSSYALEAPSCSTYKLIVLKLHPERKYKLFHRQDDYPDSYSVFYTPETSSQMATLMYSIEMKLTPETTPGSLRGQMLTYGSYNMFTHFTRLNQAVTTSDLRSMVTRSCQTTMIAHSS